MNPCMATKTISLELDAYERLRAAKKTERESFSSVVRRAIFPPAAHTGASVLEHMGKIDFRRSSNSEVMDYWDLMQREDRESPRISRDQWEGADAS
jgi:predicted CopG family antitoxin